MIVAVAADGMSVAGHFGHCQLFALYDTDTGSYSYLANPGHQPGLLPEYLKANGANVIIAGGMGEPAQRLFQSQGIEVIVGIKTTIINAVQLFMANQLQSTGEYCTSHGHGEGHGGGCGHGDGGGCHHGSH